MKQLHISLIPQNRVNYIRLVFGIAMLVAVLYLAFLSNQDRFKTFHLVIFFIGGLYYTVMGTGRNPIAVIAKAFISVNEEVIQIKRTVFSKKIEAHWQDISELQLNITSIRFKYKNGSDLLFDYQKLDSDTIHNLRTTLVEIAKIKSIPVS